MNKFANIEEAEPFAEIGSPIKSMCTFGNFIFVATDEGVLSVNTDGEVSDVTDDISREVYTYPSA